MDFFETNISEEAKQEVTKILDHGWISAGREVELFEEELHKFGLVRPVTVNSGTTSLFLALKAAGVGEGHEVIIPPQTFVATGFAVLYTGAKPVFADIDYENGNISVESIYRKISDRTKAIIPVHWAGYPCDMDDINNLARKFRLKVIEDAAQAFGALHRGRILGGATSDFTCFSFQAIKTLTTGDGGCICCKDKNDYNSIKLMRWFGIERKAAPSILGEREFDLTNLGYKAHMNNIAAALGIGNLKRIKNVLVHHRNIAAIYQSELNKIDGLKLMKYKPNHLSSYWFFPILVKKRVDFIQRLRKEGVPTSVVHLGIDKYTIFGGKDESLVNQRLFDENQINLPINTKVSEDDAYKICDFIKSGW